MKYKCLVLDHDDTVVSSTASIHYPAFLEVLKILRPNEYITLQDYYLKNFELGFTQFCKKLYSFSEDELRFEEEYWKKHCENITAKAYPGMRELLWEHKNSGGLICVVSFSFKSQILRDYRENFLPAPDLVFSAEEPIEKRKPSPYPINEIQQKYNLKKEDIFAVDDSMLGIQMAESAGISCALASWDSEVSKAQSAEKKDSLLCFGTVNEFKEYLQKA